jgi:hypothetical protein
MACSSVPSVFLGAHSHKASERHYGVRDTAAHLHLWDHRRRSGPLHPIAGGRGSLIRKHAGSKGGTAADKRMTPQQRKARPRKGGLARQEKAKRRINADG